MPKGWKCTSCKSNNRAANKTCELCNADKPGAAEDDYINADDDQLQFWRSYGTEEQKAKMEETEAQRTAVRQQIAAEKAERAEKKPPRMWFDHDP